VAVAAALLTWILLNGTNPIHFTAPPAAPTG
jgi:putative oxidoreductase